MCDYENLKRLRNVYFLIMGSIPVRVTKKETIRMDGFFFGYSYVEPSPSGSITSIFSAPALRLQMQPQF